MMRWVENHNRSLLSGILFVAFAWSLQNVLANAQGLHPGGWHELLQIAGAALHPAHTPRMLATAVSAAWQTLAYAVTGMTIAMAIALLGGILASGVLASSPLGRRVSIGLGRGILGVLRAIHELVWAWLFVAAIGLHPSSAILAVGIPYGGMVGRILADMLNDVEAGPIEALTQAGASKWQVLIYGRLPEVLPGAISYTMYRFECAVRSAAILSFVGIGGLGYQIQISLDDLNFSQVWLFIYCLVILVLAVDAWSQLTRRDLAA